MMRVGFFLLWSCCALGQSRSSSLPGNSIEDQLVGLAWKNSPASKVLPYKIQLAEKNAGMAQRSWLDVFKVQGNLNEFNLHPEQYGGRNLYFPRYNFSVGFSLGDLVAVPRSIRSKKLGTEIARLDAEEQRILIRSEVLKKYNHYTSVKNRLVIHRKLESEIAVNLELARSKFNQGNETYEVLSGLTEKYYTLQLGTKELEESLEETRLDIEAMIGVKLNTIVED
ncbi:MAG TPA: TolC family protein [Cyclobacteriaceae bacterium]|jgi:outer membrane protein TolC|nr:TolC family protein [Cyclobacteriaceae bacterium]